MKRHIKKKITDDLRELNDLSKESYYNKLRSDVEMEITGLNSHYSYRREPGNK